MRTSASAPRVDEDSSAFWAALRDHRVVLQACQVCGRRRFPPMPSCPWCGGVDFDEVDVDACGRIYSWVTVHRALTEAQAGEVPYTVAVVELDVGPRLLGRLDGPATAGVVVAPVFVDHDDWTELRFEIVG